MFRRVFLATAVASSFAFSALADGHSKDIVDTAVDAGSFTTLAAALEAAGLIDALKDFSSKCPYMINIFFIYTFSKETHHQLKDKFLQFPFVSLYP